MNENNRNFLLIIIIIMLALFLLLVPKKNNYVNLKKDKLIFDNNMNFKEDNLFNNQYGGNYDESYTNEENRKYKYLMKLNEEYDSRGDFNDFITLNNLPKGNILMIP